MASLKQVDYLLSLWTKTGKLQQSFTDKFKKDPTPRELTEWRMHLRTDALSMDPARVSRGITEAQQQVGWDPMTAKVTNRQQVYISYLETIVFGRRRSGFQEGLTYDDADVQIKLLKQCVADQHKRASSASYLQRVK